MGLEITQKFQVISSTISLTFNVVYLPSVFQIISAKLLFRYICDIPIHHICINSLVPSVKKINIGNPGIQVNYWGG